MPDEKRQIFREKSLDRLSSPDRLDQLLRIVKPQGWILLSAFAGGMLLVLAWSIVGRIPATANGTAILVRPKHVVSFQSPASGRIASVEVSVGDQIRAGALLARLHLPTLEKQLEQERARLELFRSHSSELTQLEIDLAETEKEFLDDQRTLLEGRIVSVGNSAESYKKRSDAAILQQRTNLKEACALSEELGKKLEELHEDFVTLEGKDIVSEHSLIEPRRQVIDNRLNRAQLDVRAQELDLRENLAQQTFDEQMDLVKDLRIQLNDLELRARVIDLRLREGEIKNTSEVREIEARIEELRVRLDTESRVEGEFDGVVLEITAVEGEQVALGQRLGKMEIKDPGAKLMAVAYFSIKDGKKIAPGDKIRVSPSTVERERHGSILGEVTHVSDFPVTTEAAANQVGDAEIARSLLRGQARIEVMARLVPNEQAFSGYDWTSGNGPELFITAGTTANTRATIEEVAPITLVLPFLKSLFDV